MLAFIVAGAAPENRAVLNAGLEGRRGPQLERFGRLHVVVPINEKMGAIGPRRCFRDDNGMTVGRAKACFETDAAAAIMNPLRAGGDILLMMTLGGDAWETHILA